MQYSQELKTGSHQVAGVLKCFLPSVLAGGYDLKNAQAANPNKCMDLCRAENPGEFVVDIPLISFWVSF